MPTERGRLAKPGRNIWSPINLYNKSLPPILCFFDTRDFSNHVRSSFCCYLHDKCDHGYSYKIHLREATGLRLQISENALIDGTNC